METKVCRVCSIEKPTSEYFYSNRAKGYLCYQCKDCSKAATRAFYHAHAPTREKVKARSSARQKANPRSTEQQHVYSIKHKYGLTPEQYEEMLANQGGKCAICQGTDPGRQKGKWATGKWVVDHCHDTRRVRALVCHICNLRLGGFERMLKDRSIEWLLNYIRK
jgi:hypothetical protein